MCDGLCRHGTGLCQSGGDPQSHKTLYAPDEPLDLRGLVVSKIYSDGSSKRVSGLTVANTSGFDSPLPEKKR